LLGENAIDSVVFFLAILVKLTINTSISL